MKENVKNVVKMIIYYVIASCEKQDIKKCREVVELQYDMLSEGGKDEFLDNLYNNDKEMKVNNDIILINYFLFRNSYPISIAQLLKKCNTLLQKIYTQHLEFLHFHQVNKEVEIKHTTNYFLSLHQVK